MPDSTKVTIARPNTSSLRTTIPRFVVKTLDIKLGNELHWIIKGDVVEIKKVK